MTTGQHRFSNLLHRLGLFRQAALDFYDDVNFATYNTLSLLLRLLLIAYFIFCALFLGLRYVVLPNIENYKTDIVRAASKAIGQPVSFDALQTSWRGLRPNLTLTNVVVHDRHQQAALVLPRVSATLAWSSLLAFDLQLHRLEISQPDVDIQRDADGKLYVGGIFIDSSKSGNGKGLDWVLSQEEIVIRGGRLSWVDGKRNAPELKLEGVDFVLRNKWWRHQFALKAVPPAAFARPIDVRADFSHPRMADRVSDFSQWQGQLYADVQETDLAAWKAYVDYPFEVSQGQGSVRAWLNFDRAQVADFTADLHLANVSTRLRKDLQPMDLVQVDGRISLREQSAPGQRRDALAFGENGHAIALTDFSFTTKEGLVFPTTTLSESYVPAHHNEPEKIEVKARLLDLRTLADFAERLPLAAGQREMLAAFLPRGQLKDFSVQWQGSYPNLSSYSVKGQFFGLSMNPQAPRPARPRTAKTPAQAALPGIPGFDNLTGSVDANDKEGRFILASSALKLNLPGYFAEPVLPFERLNMRAGWVFEGNDQLRLQIDQMDFVQGGMAGSLAGKHVMPLSARQGGPLGEIDLAGKFSEIELNKVGNYLPLETPGHLREWLAGGLLGGKAQNVSYKLKGNLADFPFNTKPGEKPKGEFLVTARIVDGKLNYTPQEAGKDGKSPLWPLAENIKGSIRFDRARMEIKADSAQTRGMELSNVKAVIPDLMAHGTLLDIDGSASGPLQGFVDYIDESPVAEWIGHFTEETKADGNARLGLKLHLPLMHIRESTVQGSLQFDGNDIVLFGGMPAMQVSGGGKLEFNEKGVNLQGIKAGFLGAQTTIAGGTQNNGDIVIKVAGGITADGLRKAYQMPAMQRLFKSVSGSTRYAATIAVKKHGMQEITVESSLQGLGLNLPAPLQKTAGDSLPLKLQLNGVASGDPKLARDEIRVALGTTLSARYERQKENRRQAPWRLLRGGIGINVPAPQPESGLIASVNLRSLNIDVWNDYVSSIAGDDGNMAVAANAEMNAVTNAVAKPATPNALDFAQYVDPDVLAARAAELVVAGRKLDNVVVGASHQEKTWQANIDSDQVSGYLTWRQSTSGRGLGRVTARLASLIIPKSAASDVSELLEGKKTATQIPALDIVAQNFELFGKRFGQLELQAQNARTTTGREWRINKLAIVNPDGELSASGKWVNQGGENQTSLNYTLEIADAGKLLDRLGYPKILRGGRGKLSGDLSWRGLPFGLDIPSLAGQLTLDIGAGQFLKVDANAAKLLGLLSLQSIPRRLSLDFRDVFSEGFAFNSVVGTAQITRGVAKTDNLKMLGVAATVVMDGSADIAHETANLHVVVIPQIDASIASVAYGLAVNPVIGLGTFLAQLFLRAPLARAFTFEYQVTGPWAEPIVTKLARKTDNEAVGKDGAAAGNPAERAN